MWLLEKEYTKAQKKLYRDVNFCFTYRTWNNVPKSYSVVTIKAVSRLCKHWILSKQILQIYL